ncbi:hypothetical protein J7M28_07515 [bacterium]|nr:hypothetical protein [bacterium]
MARTLIPKMKKRCKDCPPMVIPRRSYTPSRPSCIECVEKHLGAAYVLLTELNDLPDPPSSTGSGMSGDETTPRHGFSRRLRAIGHLFEAEDESQEWPELHNAIRHARRAYQADGTMPDWAVLEQLLGQDRRAE